MSCRHPDGPHHSCDYVEERNRTIPYAVRLANERCGVIPPSTDPAVASRWRGEWSAAFMAFMQELNDGVRLLRRGRIADA